MPTVLLSVRISFVCIFEAIDLIWLTFVFLCSVNDGTSIMALLLVALAAELISVCLCFWQESRKKWLHLRPFANPTVTNLLFAIHNLHKQSIHYLSQLYKYWNIQIILKWWRLNVIFFKYFSNVRTV